MRKGTPPKKKNVFFWALPEWGGGEALARIKKYIMYIYLWRAKKMYKLPERGGGVIRAMPERKHSDQTRPDQTRTEHTRPEKTSI